MSTAASPMDVTATLGGTAQARAVPQAPSLPVRSAAARAVLRQLDLPPLQVAINVTVAEVDLNNSLKYGVQFYLNNMPGQVSLQATAQQGLAIASSVAATTASVSP